MDASPEVPVLPWWKRSGVGAKVAATEAAGLFSAFAGLLFGTYLYFRDRIPPDKVVSIPSLLLAALIIITLAVAFWTVAGLSMGHSYPSSHLPFAGACWGIAGSFLGLIPVLFDVGLKVLGDWPGVLTPITAWIMGLMMMVALLLAGLSGLFGWVVGGRINDRLNMLVLAQTRHE